MKNGSWAFIVASLLVAGCGEEPPTPQTEPPGESEAASANPKAANANKPLPGSSMEMSVTELRAKMGLDKTKSEDDQQIAKQRETENSIHTLSMAQVRKDVAGGSPGKKHGPMMLRDVGFDRPSAMVHAKLLNAYLVSNIGGKATEADDNGFISRVSLGGSVETLKWIDGAQKKVALNAPAGLAIRGKELYVTDLDHIRIFDLKSGRSRGKIHIPTSSTLTAIAIDDRGTIYVADSGRATEARPAGTSGAYRVTRSRKVEPLIRSAVFGRISGIVLERGVVWLTSRSASRLYGVKADGSLIRGERQETGSLSGIVKTQNDNVLVASSSGRKIYAGPIGGPFEEVLAGVQWPGLLGWDPTLSRVLIPLPRINEVEIHSVKLPKLAKKKRKRRRR